MGLVDITSVYAVGPHRLALGFADGVAGELDFSSELWSGVLAPLAEASYFARVQLAPELGTIVWPNGEDMAPEPLHERCLHQQVLG